MSISEQEKRSELFIEYHELLSAESDRGTVIVAVSILDIALKNLIVSNLLPSLKKEDKLINGAYSPLGSFSAKIEMSYRLGLLEESVVKQLLLLKDIRNDFAHRIAEAKLEQDNNRSRMQEILNKSPELADAVLKSLDVVFQKNGIERDSKNLISLIGVKLTFDVMFSLLCVKVTQLSHNVKRIVIAE